MLEGIGYKSANKFHVHYTMMEPVQDQNHARD